MKIVVREYDTINGYSRISFFNDLESAGKRDIIHVVLDNAAAHKSGKLLEYLKNSRIQLHFPLLYL
jgi:transposase